MKKTRCSMQILGLFLASVSSIALAANPAPFNDDKKVTPATGLSQPSEKNAVILYNGSSDAEAMHKRYLEVAERIKNGKGPSFWDVVSTFFSSFSAGTVSQAKKDVQKTYANSVDQGMISEVAMGQAKSKDEKKTLGASAALSFAQAGDAALKRGDPYMAKMFYKKALKLSCSKDVNDTDLTTKIQGRITAFDNAAKNSKKSMEDALANLQKAQGAGASAADVGFAKEKYEWAKREYEKLISTEFVK